jgi:integrase
MHHVPLSAPALQLLADMRGKATSDYVFPGPGKSGHRADLKKLWAAMCKAANINRLRLHHLRHSYASTLASEGLSLSIIGALGHTPPQTTCALGGCGFEESYRARR